MSIDPAMFRHLEEVFPGRDITAHNDETLHNHGSSTIKHGRGSVLTIDLTNRCNMMCDPCFMDANQVGFVHELTWDDIKTALDNAISIKPRRQMSVQFSGGEPTLSPLLPRRGPLREEGRLQQRAGGHQRHRVREEPGVLPPGGRGGPALRLPAVRRHRQRGQLAPARRQPVRREAARDREHVGRRHRHRAGHHHRERRQQRAGRPGHRVRPRQPEEDLVPLVPAGVVHRPRRGDHARAARGAALHAVAPGARREGPDGHRRADARLVPDLVHLDVHRLGRPRARARTASSATSAAAATRTAASARRSWSTRRPRSARAFTSFVNGPQLAKDVRLVTDTARGRVWSSLGMALVARAELRPVQGAVEAHRFSA